MAASDEEEVRGRGRGHGRGHEEMGQDERTSTPRERMEAGPRAPGWVKVARGVTPSRHPPVKANPSAEHKSTPRRITWSRRGSPEAVPNERRELFFFFFTASGPGSMQPPSPTPPELRRGSGWARPRVTRELDYL
jgi:hypothetical protein